MEELSLERALYASKKEIELLKEAVGKVGIAGIGISKYHVGATGAKLSLAACLFDWLLLYKGAISAYESSVDNSCYFELGDTKYLVKDGVVKYKSETGTEPSPRRLVVADLIFHLSQAGENEELKEIFKQVVGEYEISAAKLGTVQMFCDSYYYGCVKNNEKIFYEDTLNEDEVAAAFRSGMYQAHSLIPEKYMSKSSYEQKRKERKKKSKESDFLKDCKEGKYNIPYEWPEEMKSMIIDKSFLDKFESTPEFEEIVKKVHYRANKILDRMDMGLTGAEAIGKDAMNIMILGKPGTGKTTLAYALSAATGMPVGTTVTTKHTDEDEYEGKTKIVDGKPQFVETTSLIMHTNGGIDINEEINLADPSVSMGGLGQKTEYPYIIKRNGYETVVRHPLNVCIATMNVGTNGSNPLNQALANRFNTPFILDDPTRDTFINIIKKSTGCDDAKATWVYDAYEAVVDYLKSPQINEEEICMNLSIRTCIGAIENMDEGQTPIRALVNSIIGAIAIVDVELARKCQREVIECLTNPSFE